MGPKSFMSSASPIGPTFDVSAKAIEKSAVTACIDEIQRLRTD